MRCWPQTFIAHHDFANVAKFKFTISLFQPHNQEKGTSDNDFNIICFLFCYEIKETF